VIIAYLSFRRPSGPLPFREGPLKLALKGAARIIDATDPYVATDGAFGFVYRGFIVGGLDPLVVNVFVTGM